MFTQVGFGEFLEPFLDEASLRYGVEFGDQYPNPAVYTMGARGAWGYEIMAGFSLRLFRWLRQDISDVTIAGPYSKDESPQEFVKRFTREFWEAIDRLRTD